MPDFKRELFDLPGLQRLVVALDPGVHDEGRRHFPSLWPYSQRKHDGGCNWSWFSEIINSAFSAPSNPLQMDRNDVIGECEIAPGIAAFAHLIWKGRIITQFTIQILVTDRPTLSGFTLEHAQNSHYFRWDCTSDDRGIHFDHPVPHVHIQPKGAPRIPIGCRHGEFRPVAFLEHILINFKRDLWLKWLDEVAADSENWWAFKPDLLPSEFIRRFAEGGDSEDLLKASERIAVIESQAALFRQESAPAEGLSLESLPNSLKYWMPSTHG